MDIRPTIQLAAVIKAMQDIVLPAVDPGNKMAQEQARLAIATLQFVVQRLPLMFRYDRDELDRYLGLARALLTRSEGGRATGEAAANLATSVAAGADVLKRAKAEPAELEGAIFELRQTVGELIQSAYGDARPASLAAIRRLVLDSSKVQLDRERGWVLTMGFEPNPSVVTPVEQQLQNR